MTVNKEEFYQYALDCFRPAETMLKMVPADKLDWKPGPSFMTLGQLIYHLSSGIKQLAQAGRYDVQRDANL
jgi:hypothetical protein